MEVKVIELQEWITTGAAQELTGYSQAYMRQLALRHRVEARKVGRDWLLNRASLIEYKQTMEQLGKQKYSPWRSDLAAERRGRKSNEEVQK